MIGGLIFWALGFRRFGEVSLGRLRVRVKALGLWNSAQFWEGLWEIVVVAISAFVPFDEYGLILDGFG